MSKEDKKNYFKMTDRKVIHIRMNAGERTLLQSMMKNDDWENTSGFIKYKLFGADPERKVDELIKKKEKDDIVILLRNEIMVLTEVLTYFKTRYEKDMDRLWKEEGVDLKKWISSTNRWQSETERKTEEMLRICQKIIEQLNLLR